MQAEAGDASGKVRCDSWQPTARLGRTACIVKGDDVNLVSAAAYVGYRQVATPAKRISWAHLAHHLMCRLAGAVQRGAAAGGGRAGGSRHLLRGANSLQPMVPLFSCAALYVAHIVCAPALHGPTICLWTWTGTLGFYWFLIQLWTERPDF